MHSESLLAGRLLLSWSEVAAIASSDPTALGLQGLQVCVIASVVVCMWLVGFFFFRRRSIYNHVQLIKITIKVSICRFTHFLESTGIESLLTPNATQIPGRVKCPLTYIPCVLR